MHQVEEMVTSFCNETTDIKLRQSDITNEVNGMFDESTHKYLIKMPVESEKNFDKIFEIIDDPKNNRKFNIKEYTVRISTLEEVFTEIGMREAEQEFEN